MKKKFIKKLQIKLDPKLKKLFKLHNKLSRDKLHSNHELLMKHKQNLNE